MNPPYLDGSDLVYVLLVVVEDLGEFLVERVDQIFKGAGHGIAAIKIESFGIEIRKTILALNRKRAICKLVFFFNCLFIC